MATFAGEVRNKKQTLKPVQFRVLPPSAIGIGVQTKRDLIRERTRQRTASCQGARRAANP
jgi:hypothetical protein